MRRRTLKWISFVVTFVFLFTLLPLTSIQAADPSVRIDSIELTKTHTGINNVSGYVLSIRGSGLSKVKVWRKKSDGQSVALVPTRSSNVVLEFSIPHNIPSEGSIILKEIEIETELDSLVIDIAEDNMPRVNTINPVKLKSEIDTLKIKGENFDKIGTGPSQVKAAYRAELTEINISNNVDGDKKGITVPNITGVLGNQNLSFTRESTLPSDTKFDPSHPDIKLKVEYGYLGAFRIYDDLNISADIEMYPNRGPKGTKVYFQAENLQEDMSVFFLKATDGTDTFKQANKGTFIKYTPKQNPGEKDVFIVEIPATLGIGEYDVYLTNKIEDSDAPEHKITRERRLGQRFTVIDSSSQGQILGLSPNRGPDGGLDNVTIQARNIASISPNIFAPAADAALSVEVRGQELIVKYDKGKYKEFEKNEDAQLIRTISFIIGGTATFNDASKQVVSPSGLDSLSVNIPSIAFVDNDLPVDAQATIKTEVIYNDAAATTIVFQEEIIKTKSFTFYPSTVMPAIEKAVPNKIMIDNDYKISEDRMIAIYGNNLMIHKYEEDGQIIVRYPIIKLGNLEFNKNDPASSHLEVIVMDNANNVLDGSTGREMGTKILLTIPAGTGGGIGPGTANIEITNPMRFSKQNGRTATAIDAIEFVRNVQKPYIENVTPDVVPVAGGEEVVIQGSNFRPGVKVFIDGNEVKNVAQDGAGEKITFKAPAGRAGVTQLQVMNADGGIAVWPFSYVTTYTEPKISDFNPKKGSYGTLVVIKGQNFLRPDPTALVGETIKLVGTRILLENEDINKYNLDEYNRIALQAYTSPADDLIINNDGKLADYYHSVILENSLVTGSYYVLRQDPNGTIRLTNGKEDTYVIEKSTTGLKALSQTGRSYEVAVSDVDIVLTGDTTLTLKMKTPYYVDGAAKKITGNRVKVISNEEIHFEVPAMQEGYHDLTVINPDTKRDSRTDNQGFYYYIQPDSNPVIVKIDPFEGSVKGGYTIDIIGQDFQDDGQKKTSVTINGVAISPQDTIVSPDGTKITVLVPAYPGDLWKDKGTGRLAVPVVIVNPDGASANKEKGFTYVVPSSNPEIIKMEPAKGSAAGGDILEITGRDFRFYEPYEDLNNDRIWSMNEPYSDINNNGQHDDYRNKTVDEWKVLLGDNYASLVIPVLPKVYFGDKPAEVIEFSTGYLKVKTPAGKTGKVDVYIVNNDAGVSPKAAFTYEGSNPKITKLIPNEGSRNGREKVEVIGEGLFASTIQVYSASNTAASEQNMPVVRFGQIINNSRIDNGRATVVLEGGLEVSYDATSPANKKVKIVLKEATEIYEATIENYDDSVKYVDLSLLRSSVGGVTSNYGGYELIKLEVEDRRLNVERGYSPRVTAERATQMVVMTPSYYTVAKVLVTIFNPDGGTATGQYEYKNPDSRPQITNITRDTKSPVTTFIEGKNIKLLNINYRSRSRVTIFGSDFREGAKIQIGSLLTIEPKDITYELPNKMTFIMPDIPENALNELYRIIIINTDGASASSDLLEPPIMLQFTKGETDPKITKISPTLGPAAGGTLVKIEGEDFRASMSGYAGEMPQVFFGEQPANQVEVVDYKTIQVISPLNKPGPLSIRVENPDGAISTPDSNYNYISSPKVTAVISATDPTETTRLNNVSVTGGQEIKIKGTGFMEGAKVIFMPDTKEAAAETAGNIIYRVGTKEEEFSGSKFTSNIIVNYTLETGTDGVEVKFVDGETLTVKVPPGKLEGKGLIVVNPDKGASDIYEDITYGLPGIDAPLGVTAELIHDKHNNTDTGIKVVWNEVKGATEYEIYVVKDGQMEFIGSTKLLAYIHEDIEPRTTYKFIVTAVGNFGSSKPSAESNEVRTGREVGVPDRDGGVIENTKQEKKGNIALISIGTTENRANIVLDLTRGELAGAKEVTLSIPAEVISNKRYMNIDIKGNDFVVKLTPGVFYHNQVSQNANKKEAGVRFTIKPVNTSAVSSANGLSAVYELKADFYIDKTTSPYDYIASNMSIVLDYDVRKANLRNFRNVSISRHDPYSNSWQALRQDTYLSGATSASINRLGNYGVIGGRN